MAVLATTLMTVLGAPAVGAAPAAPDMSPATSRQATKTAPARTAPPRAASRPVASCEVHIIHGLKQAGPFPKALSHLRSRLASRPFDAFRSFVLLGTRSLALVSGERRRATMVGPYVLEAELLSRVVSPRGPERLRFSLTLERLAQRQRPAKRVLRSVLVLDRGGTLFLAGPRHEHGTLVFGVTCR